MSILVYKVYNACNVFVHKGSRSVFVRSSGNKNTGSVPITHVSASPCFNVSNRRLILTEKRLAELKELMKRDPLLKKCCQDILKQADEYCTRPPLVYRKTGPRLTPVKQECWRRLYALALAWRLTGNEKYAAKAKENLLTVCAFKDWNPSHFLDVAWMSHSVGLGYDWLFDYLDAESRAKIKAGLIKNGLKPGLACYRGKGKWCVRSRFNWNLVCNSGLIVGALAIAETDPKYAEVIIPKTVKFLPRAMATYAPDGAWPEGSSYWEYATQHTVFGLAAMETALGTDFGLSKMKGMSQTGLYGIYIAGPTGLYFNFGDAYEEGRRQNIPFLFWLARRYDKPFLADAQREMIFEPGRCCRPDPRYPADPHDFIWYVPPGKTRPVALALDKYFRGPVEVAVFRSAWNDPNALFVGVKAGFNQVAHGNLDLGTFVIDALGVRWARDLGKENYNLPGYWSMGPKGKRWTYYRLSSFSHNVPVLGGKNQDVYARTKITKFKSTPSKGFAILDLTSAYKDFAKKVTRGVAVVGDRKAVLQDEFVITKPCEVAWGMTTDAKIAADKKGQAVLTIGDKKMTAQILSPAGAVFTVESAEQKPPLQSNKGIKRLMIRLKDQKGPLRITVFFAPLRPDGGPLLTPKVKALEQW
jgi:hypothetical protein